jgi:IS30 family transposase
MKKMTLTDRKTLAELLQEKQTYREIGKVIQKSGSTVCDEIKKNSTNGKYDPYLAHQKAIKREKEKHKRQKIEISPGLKEYIINQLNEDWSPEQIAGNLKRISGKTVVSHETIYQFIYSKEGRALELWKHLRHNKKPHRHEWGTRKKRFLIPERVPIHWRPEVANDRTEFGHWEADLVIFSFYRFVLAVFVERMTRKTVLFILPDKTAKSMEMAMHELISTAGQSNVKSFTFDNGSENVGHINIVRDYAETIMTFFCDPYCSWQKGTVENTNKLLRQYFPRNIHSDFLTQNYANDIAKKLNSRPRKCLNWHNPSYFFNLCSV